MAAILGHAEQTASAETQRSVSEGVWSDTAVDQLDAIGEYIDRFNPKTAAKVAAHLLWAGNSVETFPHRGRAVLGTAMRELVVVRYPYIIRYRVVEDPVRILRIRHTGRIYFILTSYPVP